MGSEMCIRDRCNMAADDSRYHGDDSEKLHHRENESSNSETVCWFVAIGVGGVPIVTVWPLRI